MVTQDPCPFCRIAEGRDAQARVVYRDTRVSAFFPLEPATTGHTLVVPRRHVCGLADLQPQEVRDLAEATQRVGGALASALHPEGLNVIQSNGLAATQTIPHLHIHLVPRWTDDGMTLEWPGAASDDAASQDDTLSLVRKHLPAQGIEVSPDDRRQHLAFIQSVVARMSQSSASAKTWVLPIALATYGYALTKHSAGVALLGLGAVLVFGLLDANYLKLERAFRSLYDQVSCGEQLPAFAMNPALAAPQATKANYWPDKAVLKSWSIAWFYGPLVVAGPLMLTLSLI